MTIKQYFKQDRTLYKFVQKCYSGGGVARGVWATSGNILVAVHFGEHFEIWYLANGVIAPGQHFFKKKTFYQAVKDIEFMYINFNLEIPK